MEVMFLLLAPDQLNKSCGRRTPAGVGVGVPAPIVAVGVGDGVGVPGPGVGLGVVPPVPCMDDPKPRTSSISCSVVRCASNIPAAGGRVKVNGRVELSVTMPSKSWPGVGDGLTTVPLASMAGAVFKPTALPFALEGAMLTVKGLAGRLLFALASFVVLASAKRLPAKLPHGIV